MTVKLNPHALRHRRPLQVPYASHRGAIISPINIVHPFENIIRLIIQVSDNYHNRLTKALLILNTKLPRRCLESCHFIAINYPD